MLFSAEKVLQLFGFLSVLSPLDYLPSSFHYHHRPFIGTICHYNISQRAAYGFVIFHQRRRPVYGFVDHAFLTLADLIKHYINGILELLHLPGNGLRHLLHHTVKLTPSACHGFKGLLYLWKTDPALLDKRLNLLCGNAELVSQLLQQGDAARCELHQITAH